MTWRRMSGLFGALILALGSAGVADFRAAPPPWRTVTYLGESVQVPSSWPVYDLSAEPRRCVLFNRHAVYLGTQGANPRCPARAIGRTEAIQLAPSAGGVSATVTYLRHRWITDHILGSMASRSTGVSSMPARASEATLVATKTVAGPTSESGPGFDTCGAPSLDAMNAWRHYSPYVTMTIYLGGANRACADGNLSSSWIETVVHSGWTLVPTYVGLQAPCVQQPDLATIDPAQATNQGHAAADDAAEQAANFGLGPATPIYFDMEGYGNDPDCIKTVQTFLSGWTTELHAKGYVAGVYGSSASTIANEAAIYNDQTLAHPDDVWIANWSGNPIIYGDPWFPDTVWPPHHRLHQFAPGHDETYGGFTINMDNDVVDGDVAGPIIPPAPSSAPGA